MTTLGQELREERERRSISLKDISDQTKIGLRILTALESDRWELMPQNFFIRGVIKAYTQTIGVDPGIFLAKYDAQRQSGQDAAERDHGGAVRKGASAPDEDLFESSERSRIPSRGIIFAGAGLLLVSIVVYFLFLHPASPEPAPPVATETSSPAAVTAGETPPAEEVKPAAVETGLRLEFRFADESWMHVTADGAVVMNGTWAGGTRSEVRAEREIVIHTGNAGGFEFTLNGRPGRPLGGPGVVLTDVRINLENAASFLKEENPLSPNAGGR